MVNSLTSISNNYADSMQQAPVKSAVKQQDSNPPQDSVQLSQAALSKAGDVDHDGDSH